jgi:hypothetical protein
MKIAASKQQKPFFGIVLVKLAFVIFFVKFIYKPDHEVFMLGWYWDVGSLMLMASYFLGAVGLAFTAIAFFASKRNQIRRNIEARESAKNTVPAES